MDRGGVWDDVTKTDVDDSTLFEVANLVQERNVPRTNLPFIGDPGRAKNRTLHVPLSWRHLSTAAAIKPSNIDSK
ncbi:hypothetical protein TNCV_2539411 [Trichonephila clavipes]|nr:hypothetical protein TNCV_2539411 [Trichonephila clavipes]